MPSRRSPSQREKGFRIDRVLGLFGGSHSGRVVNATPATVVTPSIPAPVPSTGGTVPSDVASITLLGVLDSTTRGIVEVTNAQFRDNGCTLIVEATCAAATIVTVNFAAPASPETRVGGAVVGFGSVVKVRDAAGALFTPATWHLGNLTYDASIPNYKWVSPSADNADFTSAGGTAIQLVLGGTYLFYLAAWLP